MRKTIFVLALAVALTFIFVATAFADHSPDFYVQWNSAGPNAGTGSPHGNYSKTTVKCSVCHAVHRAAVVGEAGMDAAWGGTATTKGNAATGAETELLLRSTVADACNYCHIQTGIGGVRIYNGNVDNIGANGNNLWVNSGYGHGNACVDCHAVHGAATFKGAMITKDLKWDQYKGGGMLTGVAPLGSAQITAQAAGAEHEFVNPDTGVTATSTMMDEIFLAGSAAGGDTTASAFASHVDASNIPMFLGNNVINVVNGVNLNVNAFGAGKGYSNAHEAQGSAFCTQCHMNFASSVETTVNVDNEMALFQGWAAGTNAGATPTGAWASAATIYTSKNHPMKPSSGAAYDNTGYGGTIEGVQVAWSDATYCRSCHDAGEVNANQNHAAGYVVENSYPHATPGYLDFMTSAAKYPGYDVNGIGAATTSNIATGTGGNKDSYADGTSAATPITPWNSSTQRWTITNYADPSGLTNYGSWTGTTKVWNDGSCLKCHVDSTGVYGAGKSF